MELTLDQKLKFEFANLDISGANKENFYTRRFELFLFENSELSKAQKVEAIITGQLDGKAEITIQKKLAERTFIQDQLTRHERNLNEILHPDNREKLNIWVDYLKLKQKAIEINLPVPQWTQPLIALYMKYKGFTYNDNNLKEVCEKLGFDKDTSEIKDKYYEFRKVENRTFPNIDLKSEKPKADAQLIRLNDLKLIMEDRNEKGSAAYEQLLSEIKELNKNLGYL